MRAGIKETSTITAKGQTTVPKAVRRALGVDYGGKIVFRVERDGRVTVSNPQAERRDPALAAFLRLLESDIAAGRHVRALPKAAVASLRKAIKDVSVDLEAPLDGEASL